MRKRDVFAVGWHVVTHFRARAVQVGIERVAKQLRKQGYPPEIAALILAPQPAEPNSQPPERHAP